MRSDRTERLASLPGPPRPYQYTFEPLGNHGRLPAPRRYGATKRHTIGRAERSDHNDTPRGLCTGPQREYEESMPVCKTCGEEVETLVTVKIGGKAKKVCEDCAERAQQEQEIAEASEGAVQDMMGFKGRR